MAADIFYWVFNMSIAGAVVGILILLFRRIRCIPRTVIFLLWTIPFIRLWVPAGLRYRYSFMSMIDRFAVRTVTVSPSESHPEWAFYNFVSGADDYFPIIYKTNLLEKVCRVGFAVWIILAAALILTALMLYFMTKSEVRNARRLNDNLYVSDMLLSPAVFGILHPKIVLPRYLQKETSEYVLMHENAHIRRCDNLWRMAAVLTCCIHWFNPFVWLFLKRFLEDMELSCDERVLKKCGEERKKEYAGALIECEAEKAVFVSSFGGAKTRVRIENILSYRKLTVFSGICFTILIIAAAITLLTNASV